MKQTIRFKTFETNSSSTHSLIIVPDEFWDDYKNNKLYHLGIGAHDLKEELGKDFCTKDEILNSKYYAECKKDYYKSWLVDEGYDEEDENEETLDEFFHSTIRDDSIYSYEDDYRDLECDVNEYTTKSGDMIHIVCYYGQDY